MIELSNARGQFIKDLRDKNRSEATIIAYGKDIEQLIEYMNKLGRVTADQVLKDDIEGFMQSLREKGFTNKSISRKTNSTKTFFKFLKSEGQIQDDPASLVAHPKFDVKPPRILSRLEYRALRDACRHDKRTSAIVEVLLQTGIRIGELAQLKLKHVSLNNDENPGTITVPQGHNRESREIPLNRAAQEALREYLAARTNTSNEALYVTKTGNPLLVRNIRTSIDRYFRLAGIDHAKVNDLRHTFIAHHLKKGTSLVVVSKLAGHKRLATTEKYLQYIERDSSEKVDLEEL